MQLDGQNVLITGAKGGLGNVVTRAFLAAGARVAGVSRSITPGDFPHPQFTAIAADTGSADGARQAVEQARQAFGRIDALIHLVGGFAMGPRVEETAPAEVDRMLALNLTPAWAMARAVMPVFRAQRKGRFAAIASVVVEQPAALMSAYAVSKAAVAMLLRTIDEEGREANIRARALLPATLDEPTMRAVTAELVDFVRT